MINSRKLEDLHPTLAKGAKELIERLEKLGFKVLVTQTYRDYEYQNWLYAQGRTRAGSIVTNAKAGSSPHNFGLAFDICQNIKGQEYSNNKLFSTAGMLWAEMGGKWGGSFKSFIDTPHFEFLNSLTMSDLRVGKKLPNNTKMKWESEIVEPEKVKIKIDNNIKEMKGFNFNGEKYVNLTEFCNYFGYSRGYDSKADISTVVTKK